MFKKKRDRAICEAKKALGEDIEVLDSYFTEDEPEGVNSGLWWLGKSIELLAQEDVLLKMNVLSDMELKGLRSDNEIDVFTKIHYNRKKMD